MAFLQQHIMWCFEVSFHRGFQTSLKATFLVLILKIKGAALVEEFRPISLVSSIYNLFSKVLAPRLRGVLSQLIGFFQHMLVGGSQILDAMFIALMK